MTTAAAQTPVPYEVGTRLRELQTRWTNVRPAERSNYQLYLIELTDALGVPRPGPAMPGDVEAPETAYRFDYPISVVTRSGEETTNFVDLLYGSHFALEAKDQEAGVSPNRLLIKAFGQVNSYARDLPDRPPYIMVLDVGKILLVWDRWSGAYGGFNAARRIDLTKLADNGEDIALLRDIWIDPSVRDPRASAQAVTKDIAGRLAELAASLEDRGHEPEKVARFLMRCVFSCFAEDVELLPDDIFRRTVKGLAERGTPEQFSTAITSLWKAMDEGGWFGAHELHRFNGHFFKSVEALPLTREDTALLVRAAEADWGNVEPTIFGTLLVRALDREERHRLGAEYTPRAFIERVVRPTVEEPIRDRWTAVQAEVLQLREKGRPTDIRKAEKSLVDFHEWLRGLHFLDPACGSGNFLYVTLDIVKRVEVEVIRAISELKGQHALRLDEVGPWQFHGIEINQWAREIAELTLWIGFHQFWRRHHDVQPDEPILQDTGTLERRDSVLSYDRVYDDPTRARPDPTPRLAHPVTGALVPDPAFLLPYQVYENARPAEWPRADFIIGNPPYLGEKRQREVFGDGYVNALRKAYPELGESVDYVMYFWTKAAEAVATGDAIRAGLITTNTITQGKNRVWIERAAQKGAGIVWTVADHPWVQEADGAAVRVTMTVISKNPPLATLVRVTEDARVIDEVRVHRLNADLSAHADVPRAASVPLAANNWLASQGVKVGGDGFILTEEQTTAFIRADSRNAEVIRPFRNGMDVTRRPRKVWIIDLALRDETQARSYPLLFDWLRDRVMPDRAANARQSYRTFWWRFLEPRRELREALLGLPRYIVTLEVSKHRFFTFLDAEILADGTLVCIASADAYHLGILSSAIHRTWTLAAGGTLEDRPRYTQKLCYNAFPLPDPATHLRQAIAEKAEAIDAYRKTAQARDDRLTLTAIYNILEKRRANEPLSDEERRVNDLAGCATLAEMHDELDILVAHAYGWTWPMSETDILAHLVELHDKRAAEERGGLIRWLRPDFQAPEKGEQLSATALDESGAKPAKKPKVAKLKPASWPSSAIEQIAVLKRLAAERAISADEAAKSFTGARREIVARHLETLAILGELRVTNDGRFSEVSPAY